MDGLILWAAGVFYLFLSAGFANMAPPMKIFEKLPFGTAIWFPPGKGKTKKEISELSAAERLQGLGPNKTWRGLFLGVLFGIGVSVIQAQLYERFDVMRHLALYPAVYEHSILFGALMGGGALIGDAVESFIQRCRGTPAGLSRWPLDSIDFVVGAGAFSYGVICLKPLDFVFAIVLYSVLHPTVKWLGYVTKVAR